MPKGPPSNLPTPANATLIKVDIAEELGSGRVGDVDRCDELSKEAWFYEEMECLQGVVTPRYYGHFTTMLPARTDILSLKRRASSPFPMSIILLERVGDSLPLGQPIPQVLQDDLWDMMRDFAALGICHNDLRYDNLLHLLTCPRFLPRTLLWVAYR
ncbi:hypothetical protein GLOTRDRAFT_133565 [Gloeophyllum trabeum ATCC 11539]|uniref:Protein kinase domain-containing protein n=1 Tax=Gloeophyllum trabeum (strain ATCC 11539 / FP-39264 / Madison 617) TaxID=670483 RepID=S7PU09_GLOTA|nr:uncharacterized protein GLOTRDRAFT_133565 [Gloeophyllum trabeum ATCC 11539]EPQ50822.1 hypothetical protein GLOTRDRAFT_133565 [Gloeophyllum trabeum ATCC 11539]